MDASYTTGTRGRRPRVSFIAVAVLLALATGLVLMAWAVRNSGGWIIRPPAAAAAAPAGSAEQEAAVPAASAAPAAVAPLPAGTSTGTGIGTVSALAPQPASDAATLAARESALAGQLAGLEARTATLSIDAASAGRQAARAEALLVAFAARRAIDRGQALGYLEEQLRLRFGAAQPGAVNVLIAAARAPVTLESLRGGLAAVTPALGASGGTAWWSHVRRELSTLVVVRRAGDPSARPLDRLARAQRLLDAGRVDAAIAEVEAADGDAPGQAWVAAARRYAAAQRALDAIEAAALTAPIAAPAAPFR